ncbi:rod-binding protein [Loktanella sp. F6476L]|nr:rod-binding protein [Loktanella sp. F6476L]MCK0120422.1 rod-binding protein [Loktanella sp. F6476L]
MNDNRQLNDLRDIVVKLEATFISEMLKSAGVGDSRGDFGGGAGEEQFGSFLRDAQALELAKSGGLGLSETLFEVMKGRFDDLKSD